MSEDINQMILEYIEQTGLYPTILAKALKGLEECRKELNKLRAKLKEEVV